MAMTADGRVRAAVLTGPMTIEVRSFPRPAIDAGSALLEVEANGICGTDVHWRADASDVPRILGHEVVGRVVEIGDDAARSWQVGAGDRVAVEAGIACGTCTDCHAGQAQVCTASRSYGSNITIDVPPSLWGGCAEYMYLSPGTTVTRLPEHVPADVAGGWFSPLANAVDWLGPIGADVQPTDVVVILGPGPQGLAASLVAKQRGARHVILVGLGRDAARLEAGRTLGADDILLADGDEPVPDAVHRLTGGALAHRVLDVSGSTESAGIAPMLLRRRGVLAAASPINAPGNVGIPAGRMIWNQIRWQGVLSNRVVAAEPAAHLLAANVDRLAPLVTHRFALDDVGAAIDSVSNDPAAIKVVVCPGRGSVA